MDLEGYLHGDCHIFALALHKVFGYQIKLAIDEYDIELEEPVLVHAFCYEGESVIDARGVSGKADVLEPFDYSDVVFREVESADVEKMMTEGFIHQPDEGQYESVVEYLHVNKEHFQVEGAV